MADRQFFGFPLWEQARATRADRLWRIKKNLRLPCEKRLADGSYWRRVYPSERSCGRSGRSAWGRAEIGAIPAESNGR